MNEGDALRLLEPAWLWLLPLAWILAWAYARRGRVHSSWRRWCDQHLLEKLESSGGSGAGRRGIAWLLALLLTLALFAAAGPSWREAPQPVIETLSARVLVLELSRSTLVEDVRPNRFMRLLGAARELLAGEFDGETGLVVYAGAAFVVSPLTSDARTLLAFLDALNPETMPVDGARLDHALVAAQDLLDASVAGRGQVLVFTDGIDDVDAAARAVLQATERGHRVSLLATGTPEGGPMKDRAGNLLRDGKGRFRLAKTDYEGLQRIARLGNGALVRLDPAGGFGELTAFAPATQTLSEREALFDATERFAANEGYWLVWLMLPFALLLFRRNLFWVVLLACWLPLPDAAYANEWDDYLQNSERRAYAAYRRGDFQAAFDLSDDALLKGSACYRLRRFACAVDYFRQQDSAVALFNLGNARAQQQQFPEALVAYAQALSRDPGFEAALVNQRLVEAFLQQQSAADAAQVPGSEAAEPLTETTVLGNAQPRIGLAGQTLPNPGDSPQAGAGLGASSAVALLDPEDPFDGSEQRLEEFILRAAGDREAPDPNEIERWLKTLPESSSELFRNKFLRDYQRQSRQQR